MRFHTSFSLWGIQIHIHSDSREIFDLAVNYFNLNNRSKINEKKSIDLFFYRKKTLFRGRWDLNNWNGETHIFESWSRDLTTRFDYKKGVIRSYLSSQCKFPKEVIEEVLIFYPLSMMLSKYGFFIMHAGCVAKDSKGILIPSAFGKGKTATTLHLVRQGYKFLSDEYVLLKKFQGTIKAFAFPQRIGVKTDIMSIFEELSFLKDRKFSPHRKKRFWIGEAYPRATVKECIPRLMLFPDFGKRQKLGFTKISKRKALLSILNDKDNSRVYSKLVKKAAFSESFRIFSSLIQQTNIYKLKYSNTNIREASKGINKLYAK